MLPVVAIVGRPNVGKSTLFNALTRTRAAVVADQPGVTRDRQFGIADGGERKFIVVDTGGLTTETDVMSTLIAEQAMQAIREADLVVMLFDARDGLMPEDRRIGDGLRRDGIEVLAVVNKTDGLDPEIALADFHALGHAALHPISAAHRRGLRSLVETIEAALPVETPEPDGGTGVRVAIVGRPNVGKSTLVNRLAGSERVIAHDMPGTTRDSVAVPFSVDGRDYTLIDTAGIRRRARVDEGVERFSVIKSLDAIERADVAVLVVDACDGITDQDATLLGHVLQAGRAMIVGVNKWDRMDEDGRRQVRQGVDRRLRFADFAAVHYISALRGSGLRSLMRAVDRAHAAATRDLSTPELTRVLIAAQEAHAPPLVRGRRIKLKFAHQGGSAPPRIIVHGNQTAECPESYRRYLVGVFREAFDLAGTPVRVEMKTSDNPYKGRRNTLTPRQQRRRKRLVKHVKR